LTRTKISWLPEKKQFFHAEKEAIGGLSGLNLKFSQVARRKERKLVLKRKEILPCGLAGYARHDNN